MNDTASAAVVEREAVRAIIVTPERELLLLRVRLRAPERSFWITPGGGMNPGESPLTCLQRELSEELGVERFELGPLLWRRQHTFDWAGRRIHQREHFYLLELPRFTPVMTDPEELLSVDQMRWWTQAELDAPQERVVPPSLGSLVTGYLLNGPPADPDALQFRHDE